MFAYVGSVCFSNGNTNTCRDCAAPSKSEALMRAWLMERVRQLLKGRLDTLVHLTIFRSEYSTVCVTMSDELRLMRLMLPIVATPSVFICFHSCLICDEAVCHAVYGSSGLEEEDLCHAPLSECQASPRVEVAIGGHGRCCYMWNVCSMLSRAPMCCGPRMQSVVLRTT